MINQPFSSIITSNNVTNSNFKVYQYNLHYMENILLADQGMAFDDIVTNIYLQYSIFQLYLPSFYAETDFVENILMKTKYILFTFAPLDDYNFANLFPLDSTYYPTYLMDIQTNQGWAMPWINSQQTIQEEKIALDIMNEDSASRFTSSDIPIWNYPQGGTNDNFITVISDFPDLQENYFSNDPDLLVLNFPEDAFYYFQTYSIGAIPFESVYKYHAVDLGSLYFIQN